MIVDIDVRLAYEISQPVDLILQVRAPSFADQNVMSETFDVGSPEQLADTAAGRCLEHPKPLHVPMLQKWRSTDHLWRSRHRIKSLHICFPAMLCATLCRHGTVPPTNSRVSLHRSSVTWTRAGGWLPCAIGFLSALPMCQAPATRRRRPSIHSSNVKASVGTLPMS